jgi:hypothetical protein
LALEVARNAIAMWAGNPTELLSVFTSAGGDTPIIDDLCSTLVDSPQLISPTRFIHSIHNAPAGVWSMATVNAQANTHERAPCSFQTVFWKPSCSATEQKPFFVGDTAAPVPGRSLDSKCPWRLHWLSAQPSPSTRCLHSDQTKTQNFLKLPGAASWHGMASMALLETLASAKTPI